MQRVAGMILTGGAGTRIGGDKALLPFAGATLLDAVIARAARQVPVLALNATAKTACRFARYAARHPLVLDDLPDGIGPLAGVVAGLDWLAATDAGDWLATFPCDAPFLPRDLVAQLNSHAADAPVAAHAEGRLQGVCAAWPLSCRTRLRAGIESNALRSLKSALEHLGGSACEIACEADAFFNVNTPEDLARAEAMAAGQPLPLAGEVGERSGRYAGAIDGEGKQPRAPSPHPKSLRDFDLSRKRER